MTMNLLFQGQEWVCALLTPQGIPNFYKESQSHHLKNNPNPFIFDISFVCKGCRRISA